MKSTEDQIPSVEEVLSQLMSPGTVLGELIFPEEPIIFNNSKLSPVKKLAVRVLSTESRKEAVLNKLHTATIFNKQA